jgi:hypothetical protein
LRGESSLFGDEPHASAIRDQRQVVHMKGGERRTVGDADVRGVGKTAADDLVELLLRRLVEGGGRFVQEQPVRLLEQRTGEP